MVVRFKKLFRIMLLALVMVIVLTITPHLGVRAVIELARAIDGRHANPQDALAALTVYPHGGYRALLTENGEYEILQRQVLRFPSGVLYALGWQNEAGESCIATAFVGRKHDALEGWKGRGAWSHCNTLDYTGWVSGAGEYRGFSVANGLSGDATLVKVTWRNNEVTFAQPINGSYMSVLDRHAARASRVEFFNAAGDRIEDIRPYG